MGARIFLGLLAVLVDISAENKEFYRPLSDSARRAHLPEDSPMNAAELAQLTPDEKEAYHRSIEAKVKTFTYERGPSSREKDIVGLTKTDLMKVAVQVVHEGGENNLHYHLASDTTWFVLRGGVKFYGPGDELMAELGQHEGITIPGGARYWFEKSGPDDLELLQMVAYDKKNGNPARVNVEAHKDWMKTPDLLVYESNLAASTT